ncbi:hypothetical protein ABQE57_17030 [Mycolicibacterium elephantis]
MARPKGSRNRAPLTEQQREAYRQAAQRRVLAKREREEQEACADTPLCIDFSDNIDPDNYEVEEGAEVLPDGTVLLPDDIDDEDDAEPNIQERRHIADLARSIETTGTVSTEPEEPPNRLPMKEF